MFADWSKIFKIAPLHLHITPPGVILHMRKDENIPCLAQRKIRNVN